jgi:N-methylhydantoinase B
MKRAELVGDIDELKGRKVELGLRQQDFLQNPSDVYAVLWSAAGGFGDPLERDPAKVEADVANGDVSEKTAREIYGVILDNGEQTEKERAAQRKQRLEKATAPFLPAKKLEGKERLRATESLAVRGANWCCAKCAADLGPLRGNYKERCARSDRAIQASNPLVGDPRRFIDPLPQFRQFACPSCGALIENEIAVAEDPLLKDVELNI